MNGHDHNPMGIWREDPERVTYFAETDARNSRVRFGIKAKDRSRHMYVIGKTGMGKSTMLENLAVQDIQNGEGLTFIDPHGSTAEKLLDYVPEHRIEDVLYFAPFDLEHPISFNVLEKVDADKRHLVVNGLMSTFEKIWVDAWSARMAYILQNTLLALLEYPEATLLGVNRMYTDKEYRKRVIENVTDPSVRSFWTEEFAKYTDRYMQEATPAIQNKIGQFSSTSLVRNIIGQPQSSFDLRSIMDTRKIFIVNLSKGKVGEGNANLLGSMIITKLYLAAMSRADVAGSVLKGLPPHYLYVDEFQSFANKSFADILSEARKYKLALTIAHQYIEQMEEEVRDAVFGNVGTMAAFRVGSFDAEVLEKEFSPVFTATDIVNLGFAQVYLKLMIDGISSSPFSATTLPPIAEPHISHTDRIVAASRRNFARPRGDVEAEIRKWHEPFPASPKAEGAPEEKGRGGARGNFTPTEDFRGEKRPERRAPRAGDGAPQPRERSSEDLRNVLASLAKKDPVEPVRPREDHAPRPPQPRHEEHHERTHERHVPPPRHVADQSPPQRHVETRDTHVSAARQDRHVAHPPRAAHSPQPPVRNDKKDMTEEDRQTLKNALQAVLQKDGTPPPPRTQSPQESRTAPTPSATQHRPMLEGADDGEIISVEKFHHKDDRGSNNEISQDDLEEMLKVEDEWSDPRERR